MTQRADRNLWRSVSEETILRRLNRETDTVTVSYESGFGERVTKVGQGASMAARMADADAQLPEGDWLRLAVSRPASVYGDLVGRPRDELQGHSPGGMMAFLQYERKWVSAS